MILTMGTINETRPFRPQHPGTILQEELKSRGIKQKVFAQTIGLQPSHLSALLHGARNISPQLAARLENALLIPAHVWLNLQANYNLDTLKASDVVDGYTPQQTRTYALAQPSEEESRLWSLAFRAGQNDAVNKIHDNLVRFGLPAKVINELTNIL